MDRDYWIAGLHLAPDLTDDQIRAEVVTRLRLNKYMGPYATGAKVLTANQVAFLLDPRKEVLFGGATKGGKTDAFLIDMLRYVDIGHYQGLVLDRSFTNLTRGDGIIARFREWTGDPRLGVKWDDENHAGRFPSGALITFGFIDRPEKANDYKRANYERIYWEELTEHPPGQTPASPPTYYTYLYSRLARPIASPIPLAFRANSNPDGPGRVWVKTRFGIGHDDDGQPLPKPPPKRHYIPANYKTNPGLSAGEIEESLSETDAVTQAQLLDGNWDVSALGDTFQVEMLQTVRRPDGWVAGWVRAWDKAGIDAADRRAKRAKFTVGLLMARVPAAIYGVEYIIVDVIRGQWAAEKRDKIIRETSASDPPGTLTLVEREPGSGGLQSAQITIKDLAGYWVEERLPSGQKLDRVRPFSSQVNIGNVGVVTGFWNPAYKDELRACPNGVYWDQLDTSGMAFNELALRPMTPLLPASSPSRPRELAAPIIDGRRAQPVDPRRLLPPGIGLPPGVRGGLR
jgi:phage terminase large subunit-like protein